MDGVYCVSLGCQVIGLEYVTEGMRLYKDPSYIPATLLRGHDHVVWLLFNEENAVSEPDDAVLHIITVVHVYYARH